MKNLKVYACVSWNDVEVVVVAKDVMKWLRRTGLNEMAGEDRYNGMVFRQMSHFNVSFCTSCQFMRNRPYRFEV